MILYDDFWYRAESWDRARRVVKVEWHRGELFPRVGFIVTNMTAGPEGVVRFYNGRGTAEQWIKEGKYAPLGCRAIFVPGASVSVRPGVQPWELPSPAVSAQGGQALVAAERAGSSFRLVRHEGCRRPGRSYRPVDRRRHEGGYNHDLAKREGAPGSRLVFNALSPHCRGPKTTKMDKKHGSRRESHPLCG